MPRVLETIEIGVFGFAILAYAAAFLSVGLDPTLAEGARDLRILLGLSALGSAASLLTAHLKGFLVSHTLKGLALLMAAATLGGQGLVVELLLLLPYLAETALYLRAWTAAVWATGITVLTLAADGMFWAPQGLVQGLPHGAAVAISALGVAGASILGTRYRNRVVKEQIKAERLHRDVDQLMRANQAFQDYADTIESVTEENERNRITRELHDVIGYSLTNVIMMMNAGKVLSRDHPEQLDALFLQARSHADEALQESRRILYALRAIRPPSRKGLNAIVHLAQSFQAATDIRVEVAWGNLPQSLGQELDAALFRLVQEGMTNALRHGQAKKVRITFWRHDDRVQVQVWDNGKGVQAVTEGIGLAGMRERFEGLGGTLTATPVIDGFLVTATIPLAEEFSL